MNNINKFFSEIEDLVYSSTNKQDADDLIKGYTKLFNLVDFSDYKLSFQKDLKIAIKHKAFANKIVLHYSNNIYYINNYPIELHSINDLLPTYFIINVLDKK